MPPRPHPFQQLVRDVERQLRGRARLAEWLLVAGRDGLPREVDTVFETAPPPDAGRPVRVALEYQDAARPAGVDWVEHLREKYRDLAVDRVVAVARRGFTPAARERAAAYGLRALTLAEARAADWAWAVALPAGAPD